MIKVSVIVPVYNVEKYIEKCLDSLVNQTLKEIEIIVVNDGSPDNSQEIIDKYVKRYPNKIKSYVKENGGQGSARNYGLKYASGEYIGYVDSDDFVEKEMYEEMYLKAKQDDLDIVICDNYVVSENYSKKDVEYNYNENLSNLDNAFYGKMAVWNKIYKKEIIVDNKLKFKEKVWYEDLAFTIKTIMLSNKIGYVNKPFYDYLLRQGSTMNNSNVKRNLEIIDAFDDLLNFTNNKYNKYNKYNDKIELLAIDHIYISTTVRVINAKVSWKLKLDVINKLNDYMNDKFPNFRKNIYFNTLSRNKKIIYYLIKYKLFIIIKLIFCVK